MADKKAWGGLSCKEIIVNFNFSLNHELVDKYKGRCSKAIADHARYIMLCAKEFCTTDFANQDSLESFYPCAEHMAIYSILFAVVSELTNEENLSFGDFMSRMEILESVIKSDSTTEFHRKLLSKLNSIDWSLFPKGYISHARKLDELHTAMKMIDTIVSTDNFMGENEWQEASWDTFYDFYLEKAIILNAKLHDKELFGTVPEKLVALGLIARRLGVISNMPIYAVTGITADQVDGLFNQMEDVLKHVFEERNN
jgi:hypothetical protein